MDGPVREHRALVVSLIGTSGFAVLGITLGIVSGSHMILFDGLFSLIGVALSAMALSAARVAIAEPSPRYPFGKESFTPLVIGIEGVALLATCVYAVIDAVRTILDGDGEVIGGWGISYAVIAVIIPAAIAWWLPRMAPTSNLVTTEATQWKVGAAFGVAMLIAFVGANLIDAAGRPDIAALVDPALVLVAVALFVIEPFKMLHTTWDELFEAAPREELIGPVRRIVGGVCDTFGLEEHHLRATKVGSKLYVEIVFVVEPDWRVCESDEVRQRLVRELDTLPVDPWLTVEFTSYPQLGQ